MVSSRWKAQLLPRKGIDSVIGNHPSRSKAYTSSPQLRAFVCIMEAVLNAQVVENQSEHFLSPTLPGTHAGQQAPAPLCTSHGYIDLLLIHFCFLPHHG